MNLMFIAFFGIIAVLLIVAFFGIQAGKYKGAAGIDKSQLRDNMTLFEALGLESKRIVNEIKGEEIEKNTIKSASFTGASLRMRLSNLESSLDYLRKNAATNPFRTKAYVLALDPYVNYNITLAETLKQREEAEEKTEKQEIKMISRLGNTLNSEERITKKDENETKQEEGKERKYSQIFASEQKQEREEKQLENLEEAGKKLNKKIKGEEQTKEKLTKKDENKLAKIISNLQKIKQFLKEEKWDSAHAKCSEALLFLNEERGDELTKFRITGIEEAEESQELSIDSFKRELTRKIAFDIANRLKQRKR
ncbi:MAG: hypothetical protein PHC66_03855 [Candidatus Nanoarchaeia archaeon]|nr:hypothetical protein [Candidatus Nanoarchaeia archaeon]MDD5239230.1 hypothetical protein [Candidatus Nanoarchaeia archaeon]